MIRRIQLILATLIVTASLLHAVTLRPVGVIGNSGYAGTALFKAYPAGFPGGVALDDELTLWHSAAPDRLERVALDGRVIAAYRIEGGHIGNQQHNVRVGIVGDYVVVLDMDFGRFLTMRRDADPAKDSMKPLALNPPVTMWYASGLGAHGIDGKAIIDSHTAVHAVDPATGKTTKLFDLPFGTSEHGLEVSADGTITVTGGGKTLVYNAKGELLKTGDPLWGRLSAVPGGMLGFNYSSLQRAPETLTGPLTLMHNGGLELGRAGQAVALDEKTYIVATEAGALYLGAYADGQCTFTRRFGAINPIALGLSPNGEIFASCFGGILGWHWRDGADAIPFRSESYVDRLAAAQIVSDHKFTWGVKRSWNKTNPMQIWSWPPSRYGTIFTDLAGEHPARPHGLGLTQDGKLFLSGENDANLYLTATQPSQYVDSNVRKVSWAGVNPLKAPGELAGWRDGKVAVVDGNAIVLLEPAGKDYREAWRFTTWGDAPEQHFGGEIHLAIAGDILLVCDTTRHRVLAFSLPAHSLVAQLGAVDKAGTALGAFDQPAQLAANGERVAIYDRGNQRIVECEIAQ